MNTDKIAIVVVEDQQVLSGAIRSSFAAIGDLDVVGTAASIREATTVVKRLQPDVVVSDFRLGDGDIADHLGEFLTAAPNSHVLVFTGWADENSLMRAMTAGAKGFVEKTAPFDEFVHAVRSVARGETIVSPRLLPMLTRSAAGIEKEATLSPRELDVLECLATGRSTSEIAEELYVSVNTVRNHLSRLFDKLDVHSRLEAVRVGVEMGLIRFDPPPS